jgi:hypothetical protein
MRRGPGGGLELEAMFKADSIKYNTGIKHFWMGVFELALWNTQQLKRRFNTNLGENSYVCQKEFRLPVGLHSDSETEISEDISEMHESSAA